MLFSTMHYTDAIRMLNDSPGVTDSEEIVARYGLKGTKTIYGSYICAGSSLELVVLGCPDMATREEQIILVEITYALQDLQVLDHTHEQNRRNIWIGSSKPSLVTLYEHIAFYGQGETYEIAKMSEAIEAAGQRMSFMWSVFAGPFTDATHFVVEPVDQVSDGLIKTSGIFVAKFTTVLIGMQHITSSTILKHLTNGLDLVDNDIVLTDEEDVALAHMLTFVSAALSNICDKYSDFEVRAIRRDFKITVIAE